MNSIKEILNGEINRDAANLKTLEQKVMHLFLSELMQSRNVPQLFKRMGEASRKYNVSVDDKLMAEVLTKVLSRAEDCQ